MRILSIWDTAGVFVPIAAWLNERGHPAKIVMNRQWDKYGQTSRSPYSRMTDGGEDFVYSIIEEIRNFNPTLIHVNYVYEFLPLVRIIAPSTPIVYQYHGSEIRDKNAANLPPPLQVEIADKAIVSTEDLQQYGEWFDRTIPEIFHYRGGRRPGTALMLYINYVIHDQRNLAKKLCKERALELTIHDQDEDDPIKYENMPEYLSSFEYYLDFKGHTNRIVLSKTGLEALACGCKVIHDADISRTIRDSSDFIGKNQPVDYMILYTATKNKLSHRLKSLGIALAFMFLTRRGIYNLSIMIKYLAGAKKRVRRLAS